MKSFSYAALLGAGLLLTACPSDDTEETASGSTGGDSDSATTMSTTAPTTTSTSTSTTTTDTDGSSSTSTTDPSDTDSTTTLGPDTDTDTDTDTEGSSSTGPGIVDVAIDFDVIVGDQGDAACGTDYTGIGTSGETVSFADLRFFVYDVRLVDAEGTEVPVELTDDGAWQIPADGDVPGIVLLDFEDGSGGCADDVATVEMNTQVLGTAPGGDYVGVAFNIGLPFELNHLNADEAPSPLNVSGMFWNWQNGYRFMKIDLNNSTAGRWNFHLGSQGCDNGDNGMTVPPESECTRPAKPRFAFSGFDHTSNTIVLDAEALFGDSNVTTNAGGPPGCMSFAPAEEADCTPIFPNVGIDWATADCVDDCGGQSVFSVQ